MQEAISVRGDDDNLLVRSKSALVMVGMTAFVIGMGGLVFTVAIVAVMILCGIEFAKVHKNNIHVIPGLVIIVYIGYLFVWTMDHSGWPWVSFVILVAATYDIGAYFLGKYILPKVGMTIHPINVEINKRKSYEGAILAILIAAAVLFSILFVWMGLSFAVSAGVSFLAATSAMIGDMFNSKLKRIVKVKDSGKVIPGHGGLLDGGMSHFAVLLFVAGFLGQTFAHLVFFVLMAYMFYAISGEERMSIFGGRIFTFASVFLDWTAIPVVAFCGRYKRFAIVRQIPNILVLFRLFFFWVPSYVFYQSVVQGDAGLLFRAVIIGVFIALTDAWDGRSARKMGLEEGRFGTFFDPAADKLFTVSIACVLLYTIIFRLNLTAIEQALTLISPLVYISIEIMLVLRAISATFKMEAKMPHSNEFGKTKFTLACLSLASTGILTFLFSIGSLSVYVFILGNAIPWGMTSYFAIRSALEYRALAIAKF